MVRIVTVRKDHQCSSIDDKGFLCNKIIEKGEQAKVEKTQWGRSQTSGNYWTTEYYHLDCPMRRKYE